MLPRENDDQTPVDVKGMQYFKIKSWEVAEWHDSSDGSGDPTAVIMLIFLDEEEEDANLPCFDPSPPLILRLKTRAAADGLIVALMTHSKTVWPDEPIDCAGFDPDAICKCGRRIEEHAKGSQA